MDHNFVEITVPPDNPQYIISLDNLDMSFLYTYDRSREVPLWSLRGPDYMEFQVFSQPIPSNPDGDKLENASSRRCHICEVDVPVAYFAAHKASTKHQMYSAIARMGLERIKKQMEVELVPVESREPLAPRPSTYFCESCSQAVNHSDLESHNASKEHTICKKRDKYMDCLIQMYEKPSKFEDLLSTCEEFKSPRDAVTLESKISWKEEVLRCIERVNRMTAHKLQYIDDNTIEMRTKSGARLAVDFDNFNGFCEDAAGAMLCRVCRSLINDKYEHINHERHIIKLTAAIEDKHCVRQLDQILNHCILCNEIIENSEVHILSEKHETALKNSLIDESSEIKKILAENMMDVSNFSKNVYFCNLCKMYVEHNSLEQHLTLDYHVELLAKTPRCNSKKRIKNNATSNEPQNCVTCKVAVQGGKKGMRAHRRTPDHKYLGWLTNKDQKIHHHLKKINLVNNATCKVCKIIISADKSAMDQHTASAEHQSKFRDLIQENKMAVVDEKYILCNACEIKVLTFDDLKHIAKKNHTKNVTKTKNRTKNVTKTLKCPDKEQYLVIEKDGCYCDICDVAIEQKHLDEHLNCEWHLENVSKQKKSVELATKKENQAISSQKSEPQEDRFLDQHINLRQTVGNKTKMDAPLDALTNAHQKQKEDVFDGDYCTVCKMTVKGDKRKHVILSDHRYKLYLDEIANGTRFHHHIKVSEDKITCKVCKIEIEFNNTSVRNHIESHGHHSKYRALSRNLLTQISEARVICTLCNCPILILDETAHLTSKGHVKNLREYGYDLNPVNSGTENSPSNTSENEFNKCGPENFCGVCFFNHEDIDMHRINLNKKPSLNTDDRNAQKADDTLTVLKPERKKKALHYLYEFDVHFEDVKCKICNLGVPFDRMVKHRQENSHKQNFRDLLEKNAMFRIHYVSFCECCREIVTLNLEYNHLTSEKHTQNLSNMKGHMDAAEILKIANRMFHEYDATYSKKRNNKWLSEQDDDDCASTTNEESMEDLKFPNSTIACKDPAISIGSDDLNDESDNSFASAKTNITESKSLSYFEISEHDIKTEDVTSYLTSEFAHLFRKEDPEQLICEICNSLVQTRLDLFIEHVEGMKHTTKYESFLLTNDIKEFVDSDKETIKKYHCFTCGVDLLHSDLIPHVTTESHKCNLVNIESSSSAEFKEILQRDLQKVWKLHRSYFMEYNGTDLYCKLCDSEVQSRDIGKHIQNFTNKAKVEAVLTENETRKHGDLIFCGVCNSFTDVNEIEHMFSENHKQNIQISALPKTKYAKQNVTDSPGYFCGVCNVEILGSENITQLHNAGKRHQSNIIKLSTSTVPCPINKQVQNDQPLKRISIKQYVLCQICKTKYENKPDEKRKHEDSKFHKECQNFLGQSSNYDQPESSKGRNKPVYCCKSYEQDPFYLINKTTDMQYNMELQTAVCCNNSSVFNFIPGIPLYYWCESDKNDPFYLLSATATDARNKTELQTAGCSSKMTIPNFIPGVPLYYCCESYDRDPFYLLSAESKKTNIETVLQSGTEKQVAGCSNIKSVFNFIPDVPKSQYNCHCDGYDNDPFYYKSAMLKISSIQQKVNKGPPATDLQKKSNQNQNLITQSQETKNIIHLTNCFPKNTDEHLIKSKQIQNMVNSAQTSRNNNTTAAQVTPQTNTEPMCIANDHCLVCSAKVAPANVREHLRGARHRENLAILNDAKSVVVNDYCTICKVKVPIGSVANIVQHVNGANHVKNAADAEKSKTNTNINFAQTNYVVNGFCTVCQVNVPSGNGITIHVNGKSHNGNVAAVKNIKTSANTSSGSQQLNPVVNGFCTVCKVAVPSGEENITIHVNGNNHKGNLAATQKNMITASTSSGSQKNNPISIPTETRNQKYSGVFSAIPRTKEHLCSICNVRIPSKILDLHLEGVLHKEIAETFYTTDTNERVCNICNVHMLNTIENMSRHLQSQRHIDSLKAQNTAQTNNDPRDSAAALSKSNEPIIYCNICHVKMFDGHTVSSHLSSKRHKATYDNLTSKDKQDFLTRWAQQFVVPRGDTPSCITKVSTSHDTTRTNSRESSASRKNNEKMAGEYTCQICNVKVPNTPNNIQDHMQGKKHMNKLIELNTDSNKMPKIETASNYFEKATELSPIEIKTSLYTNTQAIIEPDINKPTTSSTISKVCDIKKVPSHTASAVTTKTEIADSDDDDSYDGFYICKICNVLVENNQTDIQSHLRSYRHHDNVEKNKANAKENSEAVKAYFCEVCKCPIINNPITIKTHNESIFHCQRLCKILTNNKIRLRDNKVCYCQLCDLYFNKLSALSHIAQEKHKNLIAEAAGTSHTLLI